MADAALAETQQAGWFVELEQDVLGRIMCLYAKPEMLAPLRPEHFIEPVHQVLYSAAQVAIDRYGSPAPHFVLKLVPEEEARRFNVQVPDTPLSAYVARLVAQESVGSHGLAASISALIEQSARHRIGLEAKRLADEAQRPEAVPTEIVSRSISAMDSIVADTRRGSRGRVTRLSVGTAAATAVGKVEDVLVHGEVWDGISWGLTDLDHVTGGIQTRDLTLVGARPSIGKTTFALSTALRAAKKGVGVGFVSLEMDAEKLGTRALSDLAYDWGVKVAYQNIIRRRMDKAQLDALTSATRDMGNLPLWIEEQSGLSVSDIRVKLEALMAEADRAGSALRLLFVDHLGLIKPGAAYSDNRTQQIGDMTAALKAMAREYDIAIVLLSQLSRALEGRDNKRPTLADLRDSGAIEQDADTVIFLYREAYYLEREKGGNSDREAERIERLIDCQHKMEIAVAKQRNGPVTTVDVFVDMPFSAVRNAARM